MRKFYQSTYYFWIITKCIFAIVAGTDGIRHLGNGTIIDEERSISCFAIVLSIFILADIVLSLNGKYYTPLKYMLGLMYVSVAIFIIILLFFVNLTDTIFPMILTIWSLYSALFDFMIIKRKKDRIHNQES